MAFHACWFLAEPEDAADIRSIVTSGERPLTDWPHLILPRVDSPDINKLERLVIPKRKGVRSITGGKLLVRSKATDSPFTAVSLVEPAFVQGLAALTESAVDDLARKWHERVPEMNEAALGKLLADMAAFARQAGEAGKAVLQLDVM